MDEYTLDLDRWISLFPLEKEPDYGANGFGVRGHAFSLAYLEQCRPSVAARIDPGPTVPTDVFVFGLGEPGRRDVTKVGGLPYRPADRPWPQTPDGELMTFLVQYRFSESKDIVGDLPGDILLVFLPGDDIDYDDPQESFRFEWYPLGLGNLVSRAMLPEPAWTFVKCYGVRHRTVDYVENRLKGNLTQIFPAAASSIYPIELAEQQFCRIHGTKIGGLPLMLYSAEEWPERGLALPGRFLCSLTDVYPLPETPHPWVNVPEPMGLYEPLADEAHLVLRDGFTLNFSIDDEDSVHWSIQWG